SAAAVQPCFARRAPRPDINIPDGFVPSVVGAQQKFAEKTYRVIRLVAVLASLKSASRLSRLLQKIAFLAFTGSGGAATVLIWIIIKELSIKNMHGISVRFNMITHSGLWWFCSRIAPEQGAIEDSQEECDTISYKDFRECNCSLLLSMGCIYFIGAVDFEGLNDHPEEKYRPVSYEFGYCFKLVWLSFLLENWPSLSTSTYGARWGGGGRGGRGAISILRRGGHFGRRSAAAACTCTDGDGESPGPQLRPLAIRPPPLSTRRSDRSLAKRLSRRQPQSRSSSDWSLAMQHWGFFWKPRQAEPA
uniref:Ion_trans domain-containing protein n=1 Tax=Macrostomum lignano TaxID=282301 RepID=A0A1I8FPX1_9PLAT